MSTKTAGNSDADAKAPVKSDKKEEAKSLSAADRRKRIAEIIELMRDENTEHESIAKLAAELTGLRGDDKKAKEQLGAKVKQLVQDIVALRTDHGISFTSFQMEMVNGEIPFPKADVLDYCQKQGWMPAKAVSPAKTKNTEQPSKDPLIVGKFKLADYGFTMPNNIKGEPASTDTEFEWDYNKRYGGRAWQNAFITTLRKAGVDKISKHFTDDFKKWLETTKTSTHGRYATKPVFSNKKEFYADFGTEIDILTGKPEAKK